MLCQKNPYNVAVIGIEAFCVPESCGHKGNIK